MQLSYCEDVDNTGSPFQCVRLALAGIAEDGDHLGRGHDRSSACQTSSGHCSRRSALPGLQVSSVTFVPNKNIKTLKILITRISGRLRFLNCRLYGKLHNLFTLLILSLHLPYTLSLHNFPKHSAYIFLKIVSREQTDIHNNSIFMSIDC